MNEPRPGPGAAAEPAPGPGGGAPTDSRRATDEEKQVFQEFVGHVVNTIYEPKTAEGIGTMLRTAAQGEQGISAVEPLAQVLAGVISRVAYSGLDSGIPIEPEMAAVAAAEIAEELGQTFAQSVGVPPLDEEQVHALYLRSMELLADEREGRQGRATMRDRAAGAPPGPDAGAPAPPGNGLAIPRGGGPA